MCVVVKKIQFGKREERAVHFYDESERWVVRFCLFKVKTKGKCSSYRRQMLIVLRLYDANAHTDGPSVLLHADRKQERRKK